MKKYPQGETNVGAIYDSAPVDNPFLAAMPEMLSQDDFTAQIRSLPKLPINLPQMTPEERRQALSLLSSIFVPLDYCQRRSDFVVFRRTGNVEKRWVNVHSP